MFNYANFDDYNFMNTDSYLKSNISMYNNAFNNYTKENNNLYSPYDG